MFSPLPGFGAGSGPNQGPVGCRGAVFALAIMLSALGGFVAFLVWAYHWVQALSP